MSDKFNLLQRVGKLERGELASGFSKVVINVGTDENGDAISYSAGTDGGVALIINNPFGTQQMANNMLQIIRGKQYQAYTATDALLDPAAELGDGVSIDDIYSGVYSRTVDFSPLMASDISAPSDEEIEHELTGANETATDRSYSRLVKNVSARISQTASQIAAEIEARTTSEEELSSRIEQNADSISAKVSKKSPTGQTAFGWDLRDDQWTIFNGSESNYVLKATRDGLEVKGKITALSGTIGGFDILSNYLSYGNMTWEGSASNGLYFGTKGFKLGQNCKIDMSGNATLNNLTLTGNLKLSNGSTYSMNQVRSGVGGGIGYSGAIVQNTSNYPTYFTCGQLAAKGVGSGDSLVVYGDGTVAGLLRADKLQVTNWLTVLGRGSFGSLRVNDYDYTPTMLYVTVDGVRYPVKTYGGSNAYILYHT